MVFGAPASAAGLTVVGIGAAGYQIYSAVSDKNYTSQPGATSGENYSNEGRNYTRVNYGFSPGYRGAGFADPRLGTRPSSPSSAPTFSVNSSWARPDYSLVTAANLPVARETLNNLAAEQSHVANLDQVFDNALFDNDWDAAFNAYQGSGYGVPTSNNGPNGSDAPGGYDNSNNAGYGPFSNESSYTGGRSGGNYGSSSGSGGSSSNGPNGSDDSGGHDNSNNAGYGGFDPIVIDLDGDGVELRPLSTSNTYFDTDNDGFAERTAWAGADDGILMIDLGGDGKVTDAKEISSAEWTPEKDTDLQALAKMFVFVNISVAANDAPMRRCA